MSTARKHHFLPQGYLSAFATEGKSQKIWVCDKETDSVFQTNIVNVCAQRDFNRIDIDGLPVDFLETQFSALEGRAIEAIRNMMQSDELANDEGLTAVINLVALLVVRNPKGRLFQEDTRKKMAENYIESLISHEALWTHPTVPFADVKEFVKLGKYSVSIKQQALIDTELEVFQGILTRLGRKRCWTLLIAKSDTPDFITCDHPITLGPGAKNKAAPFGIAAEDAELVFPIGRRHALRYSIKDPFACMTNINSAGVAEMNTRIIEASQRQIFCFASSFTAFSRQGVKEFFINENA